MSAFVLGFVAGVAVMAIFVSWKLKGEGMG